MTQNKYKESEEERKRRLALSKTMSTQIVPNKKKKEINKRINNKDILKDLDE